VDNFPAWSPDGKRIAFYDENGQIVAIDVQSGERSMLTSNAGRKWSPQFRDATSVRFVTVVDGKTRLDESTGIQGIGNAKEMWTPSWSPDGRRVVFARGTWDDIPKDKAIEKIGPRDREFDFYRATRTQSWSPDRTQVLFALPFQGQSTLQVMNADGTNRRTLYDTKDAAKGIVYPVWSPDGQWIVFTLGRYGSRNPVTPAQLARIRSDGTGFEQLTHGDAGSGYSSFSPDGKRLVYRVLGTETGLRILSLENGAVTKLTGEVDNFPAWSPRGDRILFTSLRTGDFEMFTVRPDGTGLKQLTHDHGNDAHGAWSPDGKRIIFTATDSGWKDETHLRSNDIQSNGELVVMDADGRHRRQLTDDQWEQAVTAWLAGAGE
jgi:Tol biopolymer transport system component